MLGVVAIFLAIVSWFTIVFAGRHVIGIRQFTSFYLRWRVRALAYFMLLEDVYPPFGDAPYPASIEVADPPVPRDRVAAKTPPSESEINKCAATLALFTSDVRIRDAFIKCFQTCTPADLGLFVGLLRQDLGYGESHFVPDQYPYIFGSAVSYEGSSGKS